MICCIQVLLFKFCNRLTADFPERQQHIKCMESCGINIDKRGHARFFQIFYIRQRFAIEQFPIANKRICRRKAAVIRLSRRGVIGRNLAGNISQIQFLCRMVTLCVPRNIVVVPGRISMPVIQHRIYHPATYQNYIMKTWNPKELNTSDDSFN